MLGSTAVADSGESSAAASGNASAFRWVSNFDELRTLPGFALTSPSGLVPSAGVVFAGVSGLTDAPGSGKTDGAAAIGAGFGNAHEGIGGAVTLGLGSINPEDGGAFNRGTLNLSVGHFNDEALAGVSFGVRGIDLWHADDELPNPSFYTAFTQLFPNDVAPVIATLGVGNNGFRFLRSTTDNPESALGVFGSVAAYVAPQVSVIADYTSGVSSLGVSLVPLPDVPLTLQLGAWDIFKYTEDNDNVSFLGSLTYVYQF